jgi:hypothetical protein
MPLHTIMTTAKTVSRAKPAFSAGAATMTETIRATSMIVTATARTSVPNGSPVRCATTSAWYTAAKTARIRATPAAAAMKPAGLANGVTDRITHANTGHVHAHQGVRAIVMPIVCSLNLPTLT